MSEVKINNLIKLYTLCLLSKEPKHGYELIKEIGLRLNRNISASHIYPFLRILQENKFVNCNLIGNREKKQYELTSEGKEFVETTLQDFEDIIQTSVKPRMHVCTKCGYKISHSHKRQGKIIISH